MRAALPDGAATVRALRQRLADRAAGVHDLADMVDQPGLYFDTDHLNREGADTLCRDHLLAILREG